MNITIFWVMTPGSLFIFTNVSEESTALIFRAG